MKNLIRFFVVALTIAIAAGCGGKPEITEDTAPFEKSIAAYCSSHHYGMKIKKFVSLKINGNQAEGVVKMEEAEGTYGLAPQWLFKFEKQNDKWKTVSHTTR